MHSSVDSDFWQKVLESPAWKKFEERIILYKEREQQVVNKSIREGEHNEATYHLGTIEGARQVIDLAVSFHKELLGRQ